VQEGEKNVSAHSNYFISSLWV